MFEDVIGQFRKWVFPYVASPILAIPVITFLSNVVGVNPVHRAVWIGLLVVALLWAIFVRTKRSQKSLIELAPDKVAYRFDLAWRLSAVLWIVVAVLIAGCDYLLTHTPKTITLPPEIETTKRVDELEARLLSLESGAPISSSLMNKLTVLAEDVQPSYEVSSVKWKLCPERGRLLRALVRSQASAESKNAAVATLKFHKAWLQPGSHLLSPTASHVRQILNLTSADLERAYMPGAVLSDAILVRTNFRYAILSDAHLDGADLTGADLEQAILVGADLRRAILASPTTNGGPQYAFLYDADLTDANLHDALVHGDTWNQMLKASNSPKGLADGKWKLVRDSKWDDYYRLQ